MKPDEKNTSAPLRNPALQAAASIGLLLVMAGTLLPLFAPTIFRYIYAAGAAIVLISRLFSPYRGDNVRVKRLVRLESWSGIFFCVATFFLFYHAGTMRDWIAFTLAGAAIQIYTSIALTRAAKNGQE